MDTTQVPEFKLAKVGKKRDRKKGGFWWSGGGAGGGFAGATGGSGLAALITKALIVAVVATLGVGAYNVGMSMAPKKGALSKPKAFASKEMPTAQAAGPVGPAPASGLAMVSGSLDGKTPEQRAAEAAAAEAAAKAEADRKAKEEADAKKAAEDEAKKAAAPAAPDPSALAAAAAGGKAGAGGKGAAFGSKFGALSSSLGGGHSGLAGGAGLSGGVGRSFGGGNLGGKSTGQAGQSAPSRASAKSVPVGKQLARTRSMRQLLQANQQSRAGRNASSAETAVQSADSAFENNPGANQAITGGGAGEGGAGAGDHAPGGAGSGNGGNSSGPTGCGGDCSGGAPPTGKIDASPWKALIKTAAILTIIASALLIIAGIFSLTSLPWSKLAAEIIGGIAAGLGAIVLGLGIAIQAQHGPGMQYIMSGGLITICGLCVALNPQAGEHAHHGIVGFMATWGSLFTGLLGGYQAVSSFGSADTPDPGSKIKPLTGGSSASST